MARRVDPRILNPLWNSLQTVVCKISSKCFFSFKMIYNAKICQNFFDAFTIFLVLRKFEITVIFDRLPDFSTFLKI